MLRDHQRCTCGLGGAAAAGWPLCGAVWAPLSWPRSRPSCDPGHRGPSLAGSGRSSWSHSHPARCTGWQKEQMQCSIKDIKDIEHGTQLNTHVLNCFEAINWNRCREVVGLMAHLQIPSSIFRTAWIWSPEVLWGHKRSTKTPQGTQPLLWTIYFPVFSVMLVLLLSAWFGSSMHKV